MKRVCRKCGKEKDIEEFGRDKNGDGGRNNKCKKCAYDAKLTVCIQCDFCKIFYVTTPAQSRNDNNFCTHHCYSLSLKGKKSKKIIDLTGKRFGKWVVVGDSGERKNKFIMWLCKCDCGNIGKIVGPSLKSGGSLSCGCSLVIDLIGKRFGRLTVLRIDRQKNGKIFWECQCDCGTIKSIDGSALRGGLTLSCGCLNKELTKKRFDEYRNSRKVMPEEAYALPISQRNIEYLTDTYIKACIKNNNSGVKTEDITVEMIDSRRNEILSKREKPLPKDAYNLTWYQRNSVYLTDSYVKSLLCAHDSSFKHKDITPEMIELKRELIQYKRIEKELKNVINS